MIGIIVLMLFGGELPAGARLSVQFDPPRVRPGEKTVLVLNITPPPGSLLLALAQPKSLGAPTAIELESESFRPAGPLEEPTVKERVEPLLGSQKVRYYPTSFGGTVVVRLPMLAPTAFTERRAELRGAVTLLFVDDKDAKLTLAPSVPISARVEVERPALPASKQNVHEPAPPILDASSRQTIELPPSAPPTVEVVADAVVADPLPPPSQGWFFGGAALGFIVLLVGPIGAHDERKWWARWLGWGRLQGWATAVVSGGMLAAAMILPTRTAVPALVAAAAFGGMLFATGGGPGVRASNFLAAAFRAQTLHCLMLGLAVLLGAASWDATAGFAAMFLARSCAPAILPKVEEGDFDDEDFEEDWPPRRTRFRRRRAA